MNEVAQVGNVEGVQLLLADHRLGNVNHRDITGWTPVMYAMVGKSEEVLLELVADCRVDLDARERSGRGLEELARCRQKLFLPTILRLLVFAQLSVLQWGRQSWVRLAKIEQIV